MDDDQKTKPELLAELQSLRDRLARSEETLQAIQQGEVDALVISTPQGDRIFTLQSADRSYRLLVEDMRQGAVTLSSDGMILSGNRSFADLLKQPLETLIGSQFERFLAPIDLPLFQTLMQQAEQGKRPTAELFLIAHDVTAIPIYLAINHLNLGDSSINCLILTDLTEQKHHEKTLASERLGHLILAQAGEAILVCDHTGRIIQASQIASQLLGESFLNRSFDTVCPLTWIPSTFSPAKQPGATDRPHLASLHHPRDAFSLTSVLQGEWYQGLEVELNRQDGQIFNLVLNARPLNDRENHFTGAVVILTDITRRKQAEQIIRQQAEREKLLREITQRIRQFLDIQTIFDNACQEIRQVIRADRVGIFQFDPESNFEQGEFVAESVAEGFPSALQIRVHDHTFGKNYAPLYAQGRFFVADDLSQLNICHTDILAQFQVRANLVLPLLCGDQLWGMLCIHQCGTTRHWQQAEIDFAQQLAYQMAIAIQQANLVQRLQQELLERQQAEVKLTESNQNLAISNQELVHATRLKDEFLANMSHELRTPLTAILGNSEILSEELFGLLNQKQHQYVKTIFNSGSHLLQLINDILDVSKISAGKLELTISRVSVADLCVSSLAFVNQPALLKQIHLTTNLAPNLITINVDERRMRQVLINLLSNAVKFTPTGGQVTLDVRMEYKGCNRVCTLGNTETTPVADSRDDLEQLDAGICIRFAVTDTGIGIASADQAKLFQPFVQIDSSLSRHYEGTGLGLALVKQIVELHGGAVGLTSQIGRGSCFTVCLPCHHPIENLAPPTSPQFSDRPPSPFPTVVQEPGVAPVAPLVGHQPLVLLAEDNQANVETVVSYLEMVGYRLLIARNGQEAIDLSQAQSPDLILMDVQMPGVDGLEAIQTIRQDLHQKMPIIALTALVMEGDRDRCLAAGATDYLAKPIKLKQLAATIQQLLSGQEELNIKRSRE